MLRLEGVLETSENAVPYADRGWCVVEKAVAATKRRNLKLYSVVNTERVSVQEARNRAQRECEAWGESAHMDVLGDLTRRGEKSLRESCAEEPLPMTPARMAEHLQTLHFTSKKS